MRTPEASLRAQATSLLRDTVLALYGAQQDDGDAKWWLGTHPGLEMAAHSAQQHRRAAESARLRAALYWLRREELIRAQHHLADRRSARLRHHTMTPQESASARRRASEAWEQRYKHAKAARNWEEIAEERPATAEVSKALGRWMRAYEEADAQAEAAFQNIANGVKEVECSCGGGCACHLPLPGDRSSGCTEKNVRGA